jgi:hypothetical protein
MFVETPASGQETAPGGEVESPTALAAAPFLGDDPRDAWRPATGTPQCAAEDDPFDDFEADDFDDEFDDDFEEDWEDDLTEDEEFPDTFGGEEDEDGDEEGIEGDDEESPFADDPDFDD